jgi:hypothetical protein
MDIHPSQNWIDCRFNGLTEGKTNASGHFSESSKKETLLVVIGRLLSSHFFFKASLLVVVILNSDFFLYWKILAVVDVTTTIPFPYPTTTFQKQRDVWFLPYGRASRMLNVALSQSLSVSECCIPQWRRLCLLATHGPRRSWGPIIRQQQ